MTMKNSFDRWLEMQPADKLNSMTLVELAYLAFSAGEATGKMSVNGTTRRDRFAMAALTGWLAHQSLDGTPDTAAKWSYKYADAMLAARADNLTTLEKAVAAVRDAPDNDIINSCPGCGNELVTSTEIDLGICARCRMDGI